MGSRKLPQCIQTLWNYAKQEIGNKQSACCGTSFSGRLSDQEGSRGAPWRTYETPNSRSLRECEGHPTDAAAQSDNPRQRTQEAPQGKEDPLCLATAQDWPGHLLYEQEGGFW